MKNDIKIEFSVENINFYTLKRFFDDIYDYVELDIKKHIPAEKLVCDIQEVFDWLLPVIKVIDYEE